MIHICCKNNNCEEPIYNQYTKLCYICYKRMLALNASKRKGKYLEAQKKYARTPKRRYSNLKSDAKRKGRLVNFSLKEYINLIKNNECFYCSGTLSDKAGALDRINNNEDYFLDNVVACCTTCNRLKGEYISKEEMIEIIKLLKNLRGTDNVWK